MGGFYQHRPGVLVYVTTSSCSAVLAGAAVEILGDGHWGRLQHTFLSCDHSLPYPALPDLRNKAVVFNVPSGQTIVFFFLFFLSLHVFVT